MSRQEVRGYFNPQVGYLWADDDRFIDDDYSGLGLGKHISPKWNLELNGITGKYDPSVAGNSVDITAFSLDALRVFRREERVSPFLRFGVAADQMTAKGYGETEPVADNSSEAGRAQNRRVVLHVTDNPGDVEVKQAPPVP